MALHAWIDILVVVHRLGLKQLVVFARLEAAQKQLTLLKF
jgi:hypothetical protein